MHTGTELTLVREGRVAFLEGRASQNMLGSVDDVGSIVEQCFSHQVTTLLLHESNLTDRFFDLRSGEAGAILQKLFQYRIRVAIVCDPSARQLSARFVELLSEEARRGRVGVFNSVDAARLWIDSP